MYCQRAGSLGDFLLKVHWHEVYRNPQMQSNVHTCERGKERRRRQVGFPWATKQLWKHIKTPKSKITRQPPFWWFPAQTESSPLHRRCLGTTGLINLWIFRSYGVGRKSFSESWTRLFSFMTQVVRWLGRARTRDPLWAPHHLHLSLPSRTCFLSPAFSPSTLIPSNFFPFSYLKLANPSTETNQCIMEPSSLCLRDTSLSTWCLSPCL